MRKIMLRFAVVVVCLLSMSCGSPLVEAAKVPLYVSKQLTRLAKTFVLKDPNMSSDVLILRNASNTVELKPVSDVNHFWRDTTGSAMLDTVRPWLQFPTDFFRAKEHSVVMPVAYTPVCLAINVSELSAAGGAGIAAALGSRESEMQPASVAQIAAWLTGNASYLLPTGELVHPVLALTTAALSAKSALGAVVADALRSFAGGRATMFPGEDTTTPSAAKVSVWPAEVTRNTDAVWFADDESVEAALLKPATAAGISRKALAGFVLHASDVALARPSNGIRCVPLKNNNAVSEAAPVNASDIDSALLDVVFQDRTHDLPVVARQRFPSSSANALYPFVAVAVLAVDSRTFKCGEVFVAIQDLFFNLSFADSLLATTTTAAGSSLSYPELLSAAGGELQQSWPWVLLDARGRNTVRRHLYLSSSSGGGGALVQCPSSQDALIFAGRALGAIAVVAATPDVIVPLIETAEAFLLDAMSHPLQSHTLLKTVTAMGQQQAAAEDSRTSTVFERPALIIFQESSRDIGLQSVFRNAAPTSLATTATSSSLPLSAEHPVLMAAFGTGYSAGPSFAAPLQSPAAPTSSSSSSSSVSVSSSSSVFSVPLALSSTCVAYNPRAKLGANTTLLPDQLHFPICLIADLIRPRSSSHISSSAVRWNDLRLQQQQPHPRRFGSNLLAAASDSSSAMKFIAVQRDASFSLPVEFQRTVFLASNHCSVSSGSRRQMTTADDAFPSITVVPDEELISTLVATPGAISFVPCARVGDLFAAGLLMQGHIVSDAHVFGAASSFSSAASLKSVVVTQRRTEAKSAAQKTATSSNSNDPSAETVAAANYLKSPTLASFAVGDVVRTHSSAADLFSTLNVWLSRSPIVSTPLSTATSAAPLHTGQNCTQLFAVARFVEWLLTAGYGVDAASLSAETFTTMVSSRSVAAPLLAMAQEHNGIALFDADFVASALGSSSFVSAALESVSCVHSVTGQLLRQYRAVPPAATAENPASRLVFAVGFPMLLVVMGGIFAAVCYFIRRGETDDTRYAPVDATKPIVIACTHVPLKEHLRGFVGSADMEAWLDLYREAVRECAERAEVYVVKEGENCGFFIAARSADAALKFAFELHEEMVAMVLGTERRSAEQQEKDARRQKEEEEESRETIAMRRVLGIGSARLDEDAEKRKRQQRMERRGISETMRDALVDAYKSMQGPFNRNLAGPAPLRIRTDAVRAEQLRRQESLCAVVEMSPMKRTRKAAAATATGAAASAAGTTGETGGYVNANAITLERDNEKSFVVTTNAAHLTRAVTEDFFFDAASPTTRKRRADAIRRGAAALDESDSTMQFPAAPPNAMTKMNSLSSATSSFINIININNNNSNVLGKRATKYRGVADVFEEESVAHQFNRMSEKEKANLWAGLLVSVGIDVGRCDVHYGARGGANDMNDGALAGNYDYSGVPVEHADSLALIASAGQTLVSEAVLEAMSQVFELGRVGRITCIGDVDLGVPLPVFDQVAAAQEAMKKARAAAGVTERVVVEDLKAEFRRHNPAPPVAAAAAAAAAPASTAVDAPASAGAPHSASTVVPAATTPSASSAVSSPPLNPALLAPAMAVPPSSAASATTATAGGTTFIDAAFATSCNHPSSLKVEFSLTDIERVPSMCATGTDGDSPSTDGNINGAGASHNADLSSVSAATGSGSGGGAGASTGSARGATLTRRGSVRFLGDDSGRNENENTLAGSDPDEDFHFQRVNENAPNTRRPSVVDPGLVFEFPASFPSVGAGSGRNSPEHRVRANNNNNDSNKNANSLASSQNNSEGDFVSSVPAIFVSSPSAAAAAAPAIAVVQIGNKSIVAPQFGNRAPPPVVAVGSAATTIATAAPSAVAAAASTSQPSSANTAEDIPLIHSVPSTTGANTPGKWSPNATPISIPSHVVQPAPAPPPPPHSPLTASNLRQAAANRGVGGASAAPVPAAAAATTPPVAKSAIIQPRLLMQRKQQFELRATVVYSILPVSLKLRVFPPPRDIHEAKDRTLTEPISKLLSELLDKEAAASLVAAARTNGNSCGINNNNADDRARELNQKRRKAKFHYEVVEDPASLQGAVRRGADGPHSQPGVAAAGGGAAVSTTPTKAINVYRFPVSDGSSSSSTPQQRQLLPSDDDDLILFREPPKRQDSLRISAPRHSTTTSPPSHDDQREHRDHSGTLGPATGVNVGVSPATFRSSSSNNNNNNGFAQFAASGATMLFSSAGMTPPSHEQAATAPRPQRAPLPIANRPAWGQPPPADVTQHRVSVTGQSGSLRRVSSPPSATAATAAAAAGKVDAMSVWGARKK